MDKKEKKIKFACSQCGKTIEVQADIYKKLYVGQTKCLSCRQEHKNDH